MMIAGGDKSRRDEGEESDEEEDEKSASGYSGSKRKVGRGGDQAIAGHEGH